MNNYADLIAFWRSLDPEQKKLFAVGFLTVRFERIATSACGDITAPITEEGRLAVRAGIRALNTEGGR